MSDDLFDLSDVAVETIAVDSLENVAEGHGMTELAGSCFIHSSYPGFADDETI